MLIGPIRVSNVSTVWRLTLARQADTDNFAGIGTRKLLKSFNPGSFPCIPSAPRDNAGLRQGYYTGLFTVDYTRLKSRASTQTLQSW